MNECTFPFDGLCVQVCIDVLIQGTWDCTGDCSSEERNETDLGFSQALKERLIQEAEDSKEQTIISMQGCPTH